MAASARLFYVLAGFFALSGITYVVWTLAYESQSLANNPSGGAPTGLEPVGSVGLFLTAILALLIAFYLGRIHSSQGGELPEDRPNANIDDGDAEQGFFSPWSWWPIMLAGGGAILFLGVAVGPWIAWIGATVLAISLVGWTFEYYRGNFGR